MVNAWAVESRLILGARSVPEGGHEVTTTPDLLAVLDLADALSDQPGERCVHVEGECPAG